MARNSDDVGTGTPATKRQTITAYVSPALKSEFKQIVADFSARRFSVAESDLATLAIKEFVKRHRDNIEQLTLDV